MFKYVQDSTITATRLSWSRTRLLTKSGSRTPIAELCKMGMRVGKRAGFVDNISVNTVNTRILCQGCSVSDIVIADPQ